MSTATISETRTEVSAPAANGNSRTKIVALVVALVAIVASIVYYVRSRGFESTDNAFLEGNVVQVSPRVAGQVMRVLVQDNQHVNKGDLIAEIDPQDYRVRLDQARGQLADIEARATGAQSALALTSTVTNAQIAQATAGTGGAEQEVDLRKARLESDAANVQVAEAGVAQAQAQLDSASAEAERASADAVRYRALFAKDEVSKQQLDRAETASRAAEASRKAAGEALAAAKARLIQARSGRTASEAGFRQSQDQLAAARARLAEAKSGPQQVRTRQADVSAAQASVGTAKAAVEQAELALSYTKIYAPDAGYITRKSIEAGNFVQPGQALLALVSDRTWVVANFKETQLTRMRPGQAVKVRVDAYPQLKLRGHVESIQSGTGARFSLLPAENATGNYVKVVQRVPVKIVLDEAPPAGYRIGPGMSVEPEVELQ